MKNNHDSLSLKAWKAYGKYLPNILLTLFNFLMVSAVVFALGIAFPYTAIFMVPLFLLPFLFAVQFTLISYREGAPLSGTIFFKGFGAYFSGRFYGCYRVVMSFLKTVIVTFALTFIFSSIYFLSASKIDPSFPQVMKELSSLMQTGTIESVKTFLESNPSIVIMEETLMGFSGGVGFILFFMYITFEMVSPFMRLGFASLPSQTSSAIKKGTIKMTQGAYSKDFFKLFWFVPLILAGAFIGGVFLTRALTPQHLAFETSGGMATSFFAYLLILPYLIMGNAELYEKYKKSFSSYSLSLARNTLERLKELQRISEEDGKKLEKSLEEALKEENSKDDNENKEKDSNGSDNQEEEK